VACGAVEVTAFQGIISFLQVKSLPDEKYQFAV
jgi:hypothetical protein